ncbi:hypothetical protein A2865_04295 [Candidatus Woesebacteria bacterium RIFCSPHIGHO2_01_FULL_39_17]|nr:MAG: Cell division protein, septum formation initiator DivIC [Microgenomates group bacterium GW2011_GWC1_38_12]KKS76708.1 MAG: Cell division protein, septum formation initiator DivIC [Parcubacteria group bacterium GW2011_GWB1_42_9]OGM22425.1 MAG: hypothetical protein A2865_04295 [Candidatus Woesebacteria bacterium RIFCSPHIGHO2_01_FULL_39_17]
MRIGFVDRVKKIYEKFVSLILLILLLILSLSLFRSISKTKQNALLIKKERDRVEALSKEKQRLEEELQKVHSEEYIEKQLRDKLGLAKEGEIIVILPEDSVVRKFAPKVEEEEEVLPDPNWKKWLQLFI